MSVSDDLLQPTSDSFWEVGQYKRTVKRHEDGQKLCADLMLLIQERADIEKHYAKSLRAWSKKWNDLIDKGPEYGTTQGAWKGVLAESDSIAEIHLTIKENLLHEVQANIKQWKNDNYHKSMVGLCKESKELEEGFKKAQKPWAKKLAKVIDCKKKHHLACKSEKSVTNQENNARADSSMSPDAMKKLQDKVEKCRREVEHTRDKYETALSDLNSYNAKYMEEMREIFLKSQEYEEKRLKFFKEMLYGVHKCLDISENVQMKQIYQQLEHTIDQADYNKDLRWWSQNHGEEMAMHWPVFEEYSPELNTISRKEKKSGISSDGIMLTSIQNKETYRGDLSKPATVQNTYSNEPSPPASATVPAANAAAVAPVSNGPSSQSQNPFGDDEWEEYDNAAIDSGNVGMTVRALYDYEAREEDELSLTVGDIFIQLEGRDDQGWCKGKKNGRVGLFPDNYVEIIQ